MTHLFSREAFHGLVWSLPLAELAVRLNIPAYRICNLCRWHVISMPGEQHWARLAVGEPSPRTPLRPLGKGMPEQVDIDCRTQPRSTYARMAILDRPGRLQLRSHPIPQPTVPKERP